uniref:Uncharacterized protein n=1 Tax=Anopheles culicifacies TaxID=139723 RepID=A0A182LWR6_9DIPT
MAFSFPAFSYIVALIIDAFLIFFSIYHVIAFDELKTDYKNPIDHCNSLNPVAAVVAVVSPALPVYANRPVMTQPGLYDPTVIMNTDVLRASLREGWIKLAVYLLSFFYYLYGLLLKEGNELKLAGMESSSVTKMLANGRGTAALLVLHYLCYVLTI